MMKDTKDAEVELKLELTREHADELERASLLEGDPQILQQRAIYFDTPDQALAAAGLSLRIRHDGTRRMQTVKAGGAAAGMFIRPEWELEVPGDQPVIDHTTPILAALGEKASGIAPLFTVENERRIWNSDGIEIALDRGKIIVDDREMPLCELELECKEADASALFALADELAKAVPLHLGVLSKAERGYMLLGPAPSASKAGRVELSAGMSAADAFQAVANACLRHFRLNMPLVLDHRDPDALHQSRVALRRLRSAIAIYRPILAGGLAGELNRELRWLAGELGKARDLDVLAAKVEDEAMSARLDQARDEAYAGAIEALTSQRARTLMLRIARWIAVGDWLSDPAHGEARQISAREFASDALRRLRRKVKKAGRKLEDVDDEHRHELRKDAKKLRYATEFFSALYTAKREKRRLKRFIKALEALQDRLGELNDLAGTPALLGRLDLSSQPGAADLAGHARKADLLEAASEDYEALVDAKRFWR